jgi:hypothetical protein
MAGVATRRLTRELAKHKAGDEVDLRVYRDGQTRSLRARLVAAEDLEPRLKSAEAFDTMLRDRAVLGLSLGGAGSRRDTLGVLVVEIADDGPAAKAGIEEGDRIASINGVDLRVDRADAGDWEATNSRIRRLNRAMENVKVGDEVELRVYSQGQTRSIRARAARAADVRGRRDGFPAWFPRGGAVQVLPTPFTPKTPPAIKIAPRWYLDGDGARLRVDESVRRDAEVRVREALQRATEATARVQRRVQESVQRRVQESFDRRGTTLFARPTTRPAPAVRIETRPSASAFVVTPAPAIARERSVVRAAPEVRIAERPSARAFVVTPAPAIARQRPVVRAAPALRVAPTVRRLSRNETFTAVGAGVIGLPGLELTVVGPDLATYFGPGSERGMLVLRAEDGWHGIRTGDVLLTIDGRPIRLQDGSTRATLRRDDPSVVELLRAGQRMRVTISR